MTRNLLFASGQGAILNTEWEARFKRKTAAGPVTISPIGANKGVFLRQRLAADRDMGRLSVVWMTMQGNTLMKLGLDPSDLVDHPNTLDYTAALVEHCAAGGLAVVGIMNEMEQFAPWGPAVYVAAYDAIAARFPNGVFCAWEKGAPVGAAKYGGPLRFADWRPSRAVLRGMHLHGDTVFPGTEWGDDAARFWEETRNLGFAGSVVLDGGFVGAKPPPGSKWDVPFTGDVRDPAVMVPWMKACLTILEEQQIVLSTVPHNVANWSVSTWQSGRYVPGAHDPAGSPTGEAWAGCPEACAMLEKYLDTPRVLSHGSPILAAGIDGLRKALGLSE